MHIAVITAIGLILLAAFIWPSRQRARACDGFTVVWLVICAIHVAYGVLGAGHELMRELGEHVVVFGFPALLAQALRKRFGRGRMS